MRLAFGCPALQPVTEVVKEEENGPSTAEIAMLSGWRENLAVLAGSLAAPGDEAVLVRLGDRLWHARGQVGLKMATYLQQATCAIKMPIHINRIFMAFSQWSRLQGVRELVYCAFNALIGGCLRCARRNLQVEAAHLCYIVAGLTPQWCEPGARLCLLGADHRSASSSYASIAALQRTEAFEWAKLPGKHPLQVFSLPCILCYLLKCTGAFEPRAGLLIMVEVFFTHALLNKRAPDDYNTTSSFPLEMIRYSALSDC